MIFLTEKILFLIIVENAEDTWGGWSEPDTGIRMNVSLGSENNPTHKTYDV